MKQHWAAAVGATLLVACTKANPAVCCVDSADCAQIGVSDEQRACSLGLVCMEHACTVPPDGPTAQCTQDKDCPATTPHCDGQFVCVECTSSPQCPTSSPVCESEHCRGCAVDADCDSEICDAPTGTCVDEATIAYASPTGATTATCKRSGPCSIDRAFTIADSSRSNIVLAPGAYQANIVVANKAIVVHAIGATISSTTGKTIEVDDRGSLSLLGGTVVSTGAEAIRCVSVNGVDRPKLSLVNAVVDAMGPAVNLQQCDAAISQTKIQTPGDSAIVAIAEAVATVDRSALGGGQILTSDAGTIVRFTNSSLALSGKQNGGIVAVGGSAVFLSFTTVIDDNITCLSGTPICTGSAPVGLCIDNSIIANLSAGSPTNNVTGGLCSVSYSIVYPQTASLGNSGNKIGVDPKLKDPANGDYHLVAGSPAIDASAPGATDAVDFDGKARDAKPDLGAFEF